MKIEIQNEQHQHILFLDCEYEKNKIRQIAAILFKKSGQLYELVGSLNVYIYERNEQIQSFFADFTAISQEFLRNNGVKLNDAKTQIQYFLKDRDNILIVGHNINEDITILKKNGIDLSRWDSYCTWANSKQFELPHYTLQYLSSLEGWFMASPHDAFHDAWALVPIFCKQKEIKNEN